VFTIKIASCLQTWYHLNFHVQVATVCYGHTPKHFGGIKIRT